jgi:hypothetical protein
MLDLARRAVACKGWRWMPGMLGFDPDGINDPVRVAFPPGKAYRMPTLAAWGRPSYIVHYELPDLTDPATLGCLLALVREAFPGCHAEPNGAPEWDGYDQAERDNWWAVFTCGPHRLMANGATEAEALVAALEAAP